MAKNISISPNRILITNNNVVKFDTNNLYLKTDPNGILRLGGYERCPVIFGYGTPDTPSEYTNISDDPDSGGFPIFFGNNRRYSEFSMDVPPYCDLKYSTTRVEDYLEGKFVNAQSNQIYIYRVGEIVGHFRWYVTGYGSPDFDLMHKRVRLRYLTFYGNAASGGVFTFNKASSWYDIDNGAERTQTVEELVNSPYYLFPMYFGFFATTDKTTTLSIAVTP